MSNHPCRVPPSPQSREHRAASFTGEVAAHFVMLANTLNKILVTAGLSPNSPVKANTYLPLLSNATNIPQSTLSAKLIAMEDFQLPISAENSIDQEHGF